MDRYPFAIVWTPLPIITWFIPLIGHTGIANTEGIIYDFGGSFYISIDHFSFGRPTKYLSLDPSKIRGREWNEAIEVSAARFRERHYNLVLNNCHSHVADTLNELKYDGRDNYTQLDVFLMMTLKSRYCGFGGFLKQWGAFFIMILFVLTLMFLA